jgi:hypothetical protein
VGGREGCVISENSRALFVREEGRERERTRKKEQREIDPEGRRNRVDIYCPLGLSLSLFSRLGARRKKAKK